MKERNYIDDMVDIFGYDYVIGYCLCSEYDLKKRAEAEQEEARQSHMYKIAKKYKRKKEQLMKERMENGL